MARTTLLVDLASVRDQLGTIMKEAVDNFLEQITAIATSAKMEKERKIDIAGPREQIIANVEVLLPILQSGSKHGFSFTMGNRWAVKPEVQIITVGNTGKIKAYALQGNVTCCEKFIDGSPGTTTADALDNLLGLTQQMLDFHFDEIGAPGKGPTRDRVHTRDAPADFDHKAWDSNEISNPKFHANGNGFSFAPRKESSGSGDSDDSAVGGCGSSYAFVSPSLSTDFSGAKTLYDFVDVYYTR